MHGQDDAIGLFLHGAREVRVDHVLALHGGRQGRQIEDIPFEDRHTRRLRIAQPTGPAQIERQLYIGIA